MPVIQLPFGKTHRKADIQQTRLGGIIHNKIDSVIPKKRERELVEEALAHPFASPPLRELAIGKKNIVIIASDHTRPVPSRWIIPPMLAEIKAGNPDAKVTILIATGCHRGTTTDELTEKFGAKLLKELKIVIHDCADEENMVKLGMLPSGGELIINRVAAEADLLLSEGFIEPHFFAGFSGGRKSVLPGVASLKTVFANHCSAFIADERARSGVLEGNPLHIDMLYAAQKANLAFICNVVINSEKKIIGAFAGDCNQAHLAGVRFLEGLCKSKPIFSDIVITTNNGYPLDQNIYQAVKGMSTAEQTVNDGGVMIMVAKCNDGSGGESFHETFRNNRSATDILAKIRAVPQHETIADQWESQVLARILSKCSVILVSEVDDQLVRDFHMTPAHSVDEAIGIAEEILKNKQAKITVIPEGISSIIG